MTEEHQHHKLTTFWYGFALGTVGTCILAYFFGTKQGRKTLLKCIDFAENVEENLLVIGEEFEETLRKTGTEIKKNDSSVYADKQHNTLMDILGKIKSFALKKHDSGKRVYEKSNSA